MRIVLATHYYPPEVGAPQRRWDAFVGRFIAAGHEVSVLAPLPHYPSGRRTAQTRPALLRTTRGTHGERIVRLPYLPHGAGVRRRFADQCLAAAATMLPGPGRRGDVVVATAPGLPTLAAGAVLAAATGRPLVVEMRDAWPDLAHQAGVASARTARTLARAVTSVQRRADAVVTVSPGFAAVLSGRGVRRVEVIPNGVDLAAVPALPAPPERADGLAVLYAGTVGRSQGLDTAVRAAGLAKAAALRIVGEGAEFAAVASLADRLAAPVTVEPPLRGPALWEAYTRADSCLVPLRAWPAFGWTVPSKLYEIIGLGRHVSAALSGEAARMVRAARAGDVVAPEDPDALAALWDDLAVDRARLDVGPAGRAWVGEHADNDLLAQRYLALLEELCRRG